MPTIGKSISRIDALGKVTGQTMFPGDINKPNQAYIKILFAQHPHAVIKAIDCKKAEAVSGVIAIFTAKDVPVNEYGLIMPDQPVLCGPGSLKPYADRVRFVGDQVAVVIAETEEIAAEARDLIEIAYEDLPVVTSPITAMEDDAELVHPDHESNTLLHYKIRKGDVVSAFELADVIVDGLYQTPPQEHAFLQPEAGLGYIDTEGRVTVEAAGQWAHEEQKMIAHALNLPQEKVRVIHPAIGGAFGGREDISIQIVLALSAWHLYNRGVTRPVKLVWSREESIIGHHKRHPYTIRTRWGATKEGKVIAVEAEVISDAGAYAYTSTKVQGNTTLTVTGPYEIPNVHVDSYSVYTNNIPGGAFRGFGGPQAAFVAETQINKLADKLGMDPVEIRLRNVADDASIMPVNSKLPKGVSITQVTEACALAAGWEKTESGWKRQEENSKWPSAKSLSKPHILHGIGFAIAYKNIGFSFGFPEHCWAAIELHGGVEITKVILHHAGSDVGQGAHTVFKQMAAEAVGVEYKKVELISADTADTADAGSTSASRMTFMAGNAIIGAAQLAQKKWEEEERPAIAHYDYRSPATTPFDPETGACLPNFAYGYVAEAVALEVDKETGHVLLHEVICADDVGKAINPNIIEGQIEGCIVQASGYSILENFIQEGGFVKTPHLSTYLIPTILDIPDRVDSIILECTDSEGPWGVRGMAEMPYLPLAPAVIAAFKNATGVWMDEFPLTPDRVLKALGKV
jgi:CO/xanthine dehydrogenase Mo-binding subunit